MFYSDYDSFMYSEYIRDVRRLLDGYANICPCTNFYDINFHKISGELCSILEDMSKNPDKSYIDIMMRCFNPKNVIEESIVFGTYRATFTRGYFERDLIERFMKYYIVLKGYQNGNLENFTSLVNDVSGFNVNRTGQVYPKILSKTFNRVSNIIDRIVSSEYYSEMPNSRRLLERIYEKFSRCDAFLDDLYHEYNPKLEVFDDAELLKVDKKKACMMFDKMVKDFQPDSKYCENYFYSMILMPGNRFDFVNSNLIELEGNYSIRKSIFERIKNLNMNMFDDLNKNSSEDSFVSCMEIVFDSDSYHELLSKLSCLQEAGKLYEMKSKKEAFEKIKELDFPNHKKKYNGEIVSYPENCMNKVEKPKTLFRREKELYGRIDDSISYEFMEELHYNVDDVDTMISETDSVINKSDLFRLIKRKVNRRKNK